MCKTARVKKKHCCQQDAFFVTNTPSKVRNCADHLRSEISSRALATFPNKEKTRKQDEAIWIKCALCSYFDKILYTYSVFFKENVRHPVWTCRDTISLIPGTRFSLILGTRFSILGTPFRSLKHLKNPVLILIFHKACNSFRTLPTQS